MNHTHTFLTFHPSLTPLTFAHIIPLPEGGQGEPPLSYGGRALPATRRGLFIVLEGPDGAGISTQTALLRDALAARGLKAFATKEPTAGPIGAVIRQALSHRLVYPPSQPVSDEV